VKAGDALVVNPAESIADGMKVRALARGTSKPPGKP
jgi:hypothetical protein